LLLLAAGSLAGALARGAATKPGTAGASAASAPASAPATQPATSPAATQPGAKVTDEGWFAPPTRSRPLPPLPEKVTKAFVIPVRDEITSRTYDVMRRKLIRCQASGAELVVIDMDTWGGDAHAGLDISRMLKTEAQGMRVVCYTRTRSISAGSMIALACDEIVMTPVGMLGDCGLVMIVPKDVTIIMPPDKQLTVIRAEMEESAVMHGYSVALVKSMIDDDLEAWLIRNKRTRELKYVLAGESRGQVTIPPGLSKEESVPDAEWSLLRVITPAGKLLTVTSSQAREYGFCSAIVEPSREDPLANLAKHFHVQGGFTVLNDTFSEELLDFFTSEFVTALLVGGALLFGYIEFHTPGFGIFGSLAIVCAAIFLGTRFLTGYAHWWEVTVLVIGLILLGVEVFLTPGFGVAGVLGIIFCGVGLVAVLLPNAPTELPVPLTPLDWSVLSEGAKGILFGFLGGVLCMMILARFLPKVPMANWLILKPASAASAAESDVALAGLLAISPGQTGVVTAICRPAGQVRFGEAIVDAVTEGEYIPAGTKVKVIRNESNRVVVTRA
jgi:membrane-bound serine protease (ClpP class)